MKIIQVYNSFFQFIIRPNIIKIKNKFSVFLLEFITLYVSYFIITLSVLAFTIIFFGKSQFSKEISIEPSFFIIVFLGPLIEELAFRLSLKFSIFNFSVSSVILSYYLITKLILRLGTFDFKTDIVVRICFSFFFGFIVYFIASQFKEKITFIFEHKLKLIIFISSLLFSFIHFDNIDKTFPLYLYIFFLFPYFLTGLMYSYFRLKYSFMYCIFAHSFMNYISTLL